MRNKPILLSALSVVALTVASGASLLAQTPVAVQNRVAQPVVINGVSADAAYVLAAGGGIQSYSCPAPQQYVTPDSASRGWACFDAATNTWLLSALPPQQQAPAPVIVQQVVVQQPVYQQPYIYEVAQPTIIYREPPRIVYAAPIYSRSVAIEVASIRAGGRIAAAVIESSRYHDDRRDDHRNVHIVTSNRGGRR